MDPAVPYRIVAICCAIGVYALCVRNFVRCANPEFDSAADLKTVFLSAGHFAALVIGFVVLSETVGALLACAFSAAATVSAFALNTRLPFRWATQEEARTKQVEELKAAVEGLRTHASADQSASLDETCAKAAKTYDLTRREEEVLGFLLQGFSYAEIEDRLYLSHSTVKSHVRNLYRKMEVNRRESLPLKVGEADARKST